MIEEKTTDADRDAVQQTLYSQIPASLQASSALGEPTKETAPVVLSQVQPISPSDPKPVVDKASSITAHPLGGTK